MCVVLLLLLLLLLWRKIIFFLIKTVDCLTIKSVSKNAFFFHFLFTFSRAHLRAFARAYNITFFLRARAHAREKVTRSAIIDRGLSMIVGGRVGALFFIVCFLSVYRYKSSVFVSLYRMADE